MAISREEARKQHAEAKSHEQFNETIYGVICATCHDYILIDKTNCARSCREHGSCKLAYA